MAHCNTVLNQIASFFPRHDSEKLANKYHSGQKFRSFSRWSQFLAMTIAQLTSRRSLRDLVSNIATQGKRIYHLGMKPTSRAPLPESTSSSRTKFTGICFFTFFRNARYMPPSISLHSKENLSS